MAKFRSKIVEIDAVKVPMREYADEPLVFKEVPEWLTRAVEQKYITPEFRSEDYWYYIIHTPEGDMTASPGDWIIFGTIGELYPCKDEVFQRKYEAVTR